MKTKLTHLAQLALVAAVAICAFSLSPAAFAQGSLTPPGAPAPTMKTLAQIEPRTPISATPFTISAPGSYYLTTNLTVTTGTAILISANGVTLDLNGFTIASTDPSAMGYGIYINSGLRNLAILNGFIQGGVTNNETGFYNGPGFNTGIGYYGVTPLNVLVSRVSVSGCLGSGIRLGLINSTVVESCTVRTVGDYGIMASTIKSSSAADCGGTALHGDQISDSRGESTGSLDAIIAMTAQNCTGFNNLDGGGLQATAAQNCYAYTLNGFGIYATTAINCTGIASDGSYGLRASTAQNCQGINYGAGIGLSASDVAIGCNSFSSSGVGLSAFIANSCRIVSGTSHITYPYNMPP